MQMLILTDQRILLYMFIFNAFYFVSFIRNLKETDYSFAFQWVNNDVLDRLKQIIIVPLK